MTFEEKFNEVMNIFNEGSTFVLATVRKDYPTARTINGFSLDGKIYFQTDSLMNKAEDIRCNPNVAICLDRIQIQGICQEGGHPTEPENEWFIAIFKQLFPKAYSQYTHVVTERIYEVRPLYIKIWEKQDDIPGLVYLNVEKHEYKIRLFEEYC